MNESNASDQNLYANYTAELNAALEEADLDKFVDLVGGLGRIYGMSKMAEQTGLNRSQLYRSFQSGGNPSFKSLLCYLHVLGLTLSITEAGSADEPKKVPKR